MQINFGLITGILCLCLTFEASAWFEPQLIEGDAKNCAEFLEETKKQYYSERAEFIPSSYHERNLANQKLASPIEVDGHSIYVGKSVRFERLLDYVSIVASLNPLPSELRGQNFNDDPSVVQTPEDIGKTIFINTRSQYFWVKTTEKTIEIHKLVPEPAWQKHCTIAIHPDLDVTENSTILKMRSIFDRLTQSVRKMTQKPGYPSCSSKYVSSWGGNMFEGLEQALYRPWSMGEPAGKNSSSYAKDITRLGYWALQGLYEWESYHTYLKIVDETREELASYYQEIYGWNKGRAIATAKAALEDSVSRAFHGWAPGTYSAEEALLRNHILSGSSLEVVKQFDLASTRFHKKRDLLINIALLRPKILAYFLEQGLNPNVENEFGKTPLMFASQHNVIEAAKILLGNGADPNRVTKPPPGDLCGFEIKTTNVAALHYAARYAEPELLHLLTESGADIFAEAKKKGEPIGELPVDWLLRYLEEDSDGRNRTRRLRHRAELVGLLTLSEDSARYQESVKLTQKAMKLEEAGKFSEARETITKAIEENPLNEDAIITLSRISLETKDIASAYNPALATQRRAQKPSNLAEAYEYLNYACGFGRGPSHCGSPHLHSLLYAWLNDPTETRANSLRTMVTLPAEPSKDRVCDIDTGQGLVRAFFTDQRYPIFTELPWGVRIYVSYPQQLSIDKVSWLTRLNKRLIGERIEQHRFEDIQIDVWYHSGIYAIDFEKPVSIGPWNCEPAYIVPPEKEKT